MVDKHPELSDNDHPQLYCWACELADDDCEECPIRGQLTDTSDGCVFEYYELEYALVQHDWETAITMAKKIRDAWPEDFVE